MSVEYPDPDTVTRVQNRYGADYVIERYGELFHLTRPIMRRNGRAYTPRIIMDRANVIKVCNALIDAAENRAP
ncbi:hypothetical protein [Mycolicibacterium sp. J2]|uniref:hypothetical protein n=1 Tax=Mycolicibacterium sp. J2 TaxID=2993511 RepID=UPI00224A623E|nr:hypothetical protein [Mycolicibacterium sp. J2]MCX2714212.1 hypothetical protein [Mycolicibacterium sp. J2]